MMLANKKWSKTIQYQLQAEPWSIRSINGELYCCHSKGITVYDTKFKPVHAILKDDMGQCYAVASTGDGNLIVAADNGVFYINREGRQDLGFECLKYSVIFVNYIYNGFEVIMF